MTTIVVHGTKLIAGAQHTSWWFDSWHQGGFLHALASAMVAMSGWHDVWAVDGVPVKEIPALQSNWNLMTGTMGQVSSHEGHFIWSGADMGIARDAGADGLVDYLNMVASLTDEPVRIVAYSHGCNVVKHASASKRLDPAMFIESAVFLGCPHFYAQAGDDLVFNYKLNPHRFGRVLNLYSEKDTVQVGFADAVTGPAGARWEDHLAPRSARVDQDPDTIGLYEDFELEIEDPIEGIRAHSIVHGALAGTIAGAWINAPGGMEDVITAFGGTIPAATPQDDGA